MLAFLGVIIILVISFILINFLLLWICNKHPQWRNIAAFIVELISAYAALFVLDMLMQAAIGELPIENIIAPTFTWIGISFGCHYLASKTTISVKSLYIPYLIFSLIALLGVFLHTYYFFIALPLLLVSFIISKITVIKDENKKTEDLPVRNKRHLLDQENTMAIRNLSDLIIIGSFECTKSIDDIIDYPTDKEKTEKRTYALFEFTYFFMHMINRLALSVLGPEKRIKLQEILGPMVIDSTLKSYFDHWPQEYKIEINNEFYDKLNDAETEYSSCDELISRNNPFSDAALFSKLAKNIAGLLGHPNNPELIMKVIESSVKVWKSMNFQEVVNTAGKELHLLS